jgi:hypothetical protein
MTLDEARECLSVPRDANVQQVQEAFRTKARLVHPDRHPDAAADEHARLSQEFDRARRARDALVSWARQSASTPTATRPSAPTSPHPTPPPHTEHVPTDPPRQRARPRTSESRQPSPEPARVTLRFEEFVRLTDAAGFGVGQRTRRHIDWPRIIAWTTVGTLAGGLAAASVLAGTGILVV